MNFIDYDSPLEREVMDPLMIKIERPDLNDDFKN